MALSLTFVTEEEFHRRNTEALNNGYWRQDIRIFPPGSCWYLPWMFDPEEATKEEVAYNLEAAKRGDRTFLSVHYWEAWAAIRPPIWVVCPNGRDWIVDSVSSNGTGWVVTGSPEDGTLTCSPSIVVPGYHGYLKNGTFTDDIEGRGAMGIAKEQPPSKRDLYPENYT